MSRPSSRENTLDIVRGSLDQITRPTSNRFRAGSRASVLSSASSVGRTSAINAQASLEFLPPERSDIEVEDYVSSGDESSVSEEEFESAEFVQDQVVPAPDNFSRANWRQNSVQSNKNIITEAKDNSDVPSDEERQIIRDIREEIKNQVREEMKGELGQYRTASAKPEEPEPDEFEDMDPKLKEAILKMRKFDRILQKRTKREREVKRDRILLQKRLREVVDQLEKDGSKQGKDVKTNTERFLSLAPPPKHDEGVFEEMEDQGYTPLFQTQFMEADRKPGGTESQASGSVQLNLGEEDEANKKNKKKDRNQKKQDFIKRNIELASDASNMIAMTDDEKKRIGDLLSDIDLLADQPDNSENEGNANEPFQVAVHSGEGFLPEEGEKRRLHDIDEKLKLLLPAEDFESISSTPRSVNIDAYQHVLFTRTNMRSSVDVDKLGEHALKVTKEERDLQRKLHDIEYELSHLSSAVEMEMDSPTLSEGQLQDLLDQCSRTMSRVTAETESLALSPRSQISTRMQLYENPPKLPDDVLQALLAEARGTQTPRKAGDTHRSDAGPEESITEETVQELLRDSRATSRIGSRPNSIQSDVDAKIQAMTGDSPNGSSGQMNNAVETLNNLRVANTDRRQTDIVHNRFLDSESDSDSEEDLNALRERFGHVNLRDLIFGSSDDESNTMYPRPPSTGQRSSSSRRSRNYSPALKNSD